MLANEKTQFLIGSSCGPAITATTNQENNKHSTDEGLYRQKVLAIVGTYSHTKTLTDKRISPKRPGRKNAPTVIFRQAKNTNTQQRSE